MGAMITAVWRYLQLQKVLDHPKVAGMLTVAEVWYKRQPEKVRLAVMIATAIALGLVLFA